MAKIFNAHNQVGQKEKNSLNGFPYIIILINFPIDFLNLSQRLLTYVQYHFCSDKLSRFLLTLLLFLFYSSYFLSHSYRLKSCVANSRRFEFCFLSSKIEILYLRKLISYIFPLTLNVKGIK